MKREDPSQWCYLSGRVSVLENNLLRSDFFHALLALEGVGDVFLFFRDSPLREYLPDLENLLYFEDTVIRRYFSILGEISTLSPSPAVCEIFQSRYDLINLKNFLKEKLLKLRRPSAFPSPFGDTAWEDLWQGRETPLSGVYSQALDVLKGHSQEAVRERRLVDDLLDCAYLCHLPELAEKTYSALIKDYTLEYQRFKSILIIWRATGRRRAEVLKFLPECATFDRFINLPPEEEKGFFLETLPVKFIEAIFTGDRKELLTRYEKTTEDYLMEKLQPARYIPFGPERVFGYLCGLGTELYNLRIALGGKINRLSPDIISKNLRKGYV